MEDSLYDSKSMRRFAGIELAEDVVPDESTILCFRRPLELHRRSEETFAQIRALLEAKRLLLKSGTIVDATIIEAQTSVDAFHQTALRIGGQDNGAPGLRLHYGPHYYAAFLIDPDGHRIEAVTQISSI